MSFPEFLLGIHNFKGRSEDELDISRGDYVEVIEDDSEFNDSWYFGRNLTTNIAGLFPKSFTAPVSEIPPEVAQRKAEFDAMNVEGEGEQGERIPLPSVQAPINGQGEGQVNGQINGQFNGQSSGDYSYERTPDASQQFIPQPQAGPRHPSLSRLSIQDPSTSSTDPSFATESAPNSASSVEPGFNGMNGNGEGKKTVYQNVESQMSQASDIDAAISAMQNSPRQNAPQPSSQSTSRQPSFNLTPASNGGVMSWTPQQVEAYFTSKGLAEDAPKFVKHRITGAILLEMDRETLKEIDIVSFGPRFEIDKEIRNLRQAVGFTPIGSPQSPGTPMSPQSYNGTMLASPMASASMNSIMNTPVANQGGYFAYNPQGGGMSTSTLSPGGVPQQGYPSSPQQQQQQPQGMLHQGVMQGYTPSPLQQQPQHVVSSPRAPSQHTYTPVAPNGVPSSASGYRTASQTNSQYPQSQPVQISQSKPQQPYSQHSRNPSGGALRSKSPGVYGSEEEITGSLGSNFSMKPPSAAIAAAQAAGRGGHHRRSSSATSRYSIMGGHQRTRTLDDWDSVAPSIEKYDHGTPNNGHRRSISRSSANSHQRNGSLSQDHSAGDDSNRAKSHTRNVSTDSKKQRRTSMLSLLSGSPKKKSSYGALSNGGGNESPSISSPNETMNSTSSSKDTPSSSASGNSNGKRTSSENTFKSIIRPSLGKQKTSAFQEGIQNITADKSAATAVKSGWMHKRGGTGIGVWSKRFFTLHGTRLSYFTSFKDTKERGLIDITGHRVVLVKDHELLVNISAAGMGAGRHCFKLIPPGPGYKKGVAFTAPKVHYFALDSAEEMRQWQSALMSATIERDESIPVESTCKLPTISLSKAQELMAERLKTKGEIGSLSK